MPEVELVIKADNSQYISKVRETQKVTQDLHNTTEKELKREKGLIEDIETEINRLNEAKKKAWRVEDIEKYNRKLQEAKRDLQEYEQAGLKVQKQTESLSATIGKWALSLGGAALLLSKLKDAFLDTTGGMNLFNTVGAVTKQILNDIVSGVGISLTNIQQAIATQGTLNKLRLEDSFEQVESAKLNNKYQQEYAKAIDQTLSKEDQLNAIDNALKAHNASIDIQVKHITEAREAIQELLEVNPTNEKLLVQFNNLNTQLENLDAQRVASTKRLISRRSGIIEDMFGGAKVTTLYQEAIKEWEEKINKEIDRENKEKIKKQEDFQRLSLKLLDDYQKSQIDSLTGVERLKAERDFGLQQIREAREQLAKLGTITEGQDAIFQAMGANVWKAFYEGVIKEAKNTPAQKEAITKALLEGMPTPEGLQKGFGKWQQDFITANEGGEFSVWKLMGIDPESDEGKQAIDAIKQAVDTVASVLDETFQRRVDDAQRNRELLDNQIAESQRSLELETQLMEDGFANNVSAKKKEVEELKKQRDKALLQEEEAIKKQRTFETIQQLTSLITASANIFKSLSALGPIGIGIAVATIATMFGAFAAAKAQAAGATKLASGGSGTETGIVTGKKHSQGGERFLDHIEIERGEAWGVLSQNATNKYGKVFHEMVNSFNRNEIPEFINNNAINVDNSGPNSRLDKVIKEQQKLNQKIVQSQLYTVGNKKIYKNGNKIRIVG